MKDIYCCTVIPDSQRLVDALRAARWDEAAGLLHRLKGVMLTLRADDALGMIAAVESQFFAQAALNQADALQALMTSDMFLRRHFAGDELITPP
ncbi:hypothetical protein [Pandoraea sp.]|uniref:hypothetical protein n=1 Tax=Pandoraea sp. TaxID=1883445 RepID=UPI00120BC1D1|nr:hypothetical protein [Pandoraea sp.]TAL53592.1 MAG: hypothetical protein EPN80_15010 [Pandoraea sp.]TAM14865.1 MAG: hypothetical protein EPN65_20030 [Pandoraea sp.]